MTIDIDPREIKQNIDSVIVAVFGEGVYAEIAATIINILRERGLTSYDTQEIIKTHGFSQSSFYKVLHKMQKLGMIVKFRSKYYLSKDFGNAMLRIAKAWRALFD